MADTIQFDLVSPERSLASLTVSAVQIPGADGDLTAMPDHAPLITTLRPGILTVQAPGETNEYVVFGGFAQIGRDGISVLAEKAVPKAEMTRDTLDTMLTQAREAHQAAQSAEGAAVDEAAKLVADIEALSAQMSL